MSHEPTRPPPGVPAARSGSGAVEEGRAGEWKHVEVDRPDAEGIDRDELREFLEADEYAVHVDPIFKERLRRKLWKWLRVSMRER